MIYKIGTKIMFKEMKLKQYGANKGEIFTIIETKKRDSNNTYAKIKNKRLEPKKLYHTNIFEIATDRDILEYKIKSSFIN